jgi:hypothetical protein
MDSRPPSHTRPSGAPSAPRRRLRRSVATVAAAAAAGVSPFGFPAAGEGQLGLDVSASLGGCGRSGDGISCRIDVAYGSLPLASHYTAVVARPNGTTQDFGRVPEGDISLPVTYTGDGTYTVTITAWSGGGVAARDSAAP